MSELATIALETNLPMNVTGWGVLVISLLLTAAWLRYVYR